MAAVGDLAEVLGVGAGLGVGDDGLGVARVHGGLGLADDGEGKPSLGGPAGNAAVGVAVDEECLRGLGEVSREMDGRGALADSAFEGRHGDDHGAMILEPSFTQLGDYSDLQISGALIIRWFD